MDGDDEEDGVPVLYFITYNTDMTTTSFKVGDGVDDLEYWEQDEEGTYFIYYNDSNYDTFKVDTVDNGDGTFTKTLEDDSLYTFYLTIEEELLFDPYKQ